MSRDQRLAELSVLRDKAKNLIAELAESSDLDGEVALLEELSREIRAYHQEYLDLCHRIDRKMRNSDYSNSQMVDLGFLFREDEVLFDDWRKDALARKDMFGKKVAYKLYRQLV